MEKIIGNGWTLYILNKSEESIDIGNSEKYEDCDILVRVYKGGSIRWKTYNDHYYMDIEEYEALNKIIKENL